MKQSIIALICILLPLFPTSAQGLTAQQIVARADAQQRGISSQTEMTMTIVRPTWKRSISMKSWSKGEQYALTIITAPAKDKGQGFLKRNTELWNWIPSIDRLVKMNASVMGQSWMGSDFTNDDMVQRSSIVNDYNARIIGEQNLRGYDCYLIELIPHSDAAIVWGKVIAWIDKSNYLIVRNENFDEDMKLTQTLDNYDFKLFGKRTAPSRMEIAPADKPGQKTIVSIDRATYDQPVNDSFFSQQNLKTIQ